MGGHRLLNNNNNKSEKASWVTRELCPLAKNVIPGSGGIHYRNDEAVNSGKSMVSSLPGASENRA